MKDLIKAIRTAANMNQEQFASSLGTTPLSINRWENGKTLPNRMAQTQLYNFCKERSIDVAKLIVDTKAYADTDNKLILYHGSKKGIIGDVAPISREECDFGRGFYMGTSTLQPLTLICNEDKPKFYAVELDLTGLKVLTVDIGMDWAMLIAYHRKEMESAKGTAVYEKYAHMADGYDVIIGYIANDRMYTELFRFFNKTLTDVALIHCLSALDLGKQYVAISEKACRQIKILKEEPLSPLELALLKDMSAERRKEGVALAEEVVRLIEEDKSDFTFSYDDSLSIREKIEAIAKKIYGADGVDFIGKSAAEIDTIESLGFRNLPVCIAKSQYSLSDDAKKLGRPSGFRISIRSAKVSAGAGFVVALAGDIMTMPGLPKIPAAENIDVDSTGKISGLF